MIHSLEGNEIKCMVHLDLLTTNNETEYEALVAGIDLAKVAGATSVVVYCDFQVVIGQLNGDYECKGEHMKKYLEQVRKRVRDDLQARFVQILRKENKQADRLAKAALVEHLLVSSKVFSFFQVSPMIDGIIVQEIGLKINWTTPIVSYLRDGTLVDGKGAARKLKAQAA